LRDLVESGLCDFDSGAFEFCKQYWLCIVGENHQVKSLFQLINTEGSFDSDEFWIYYQGIDEVYNPQLPYDLFGRCYHVFFTQTVKDLRKAILVFLVTKSGLKREKVDGE
jgi:hypothetical protein